MITKKHKLRINTGTYWYKASNRFCNNICYCGLGVEQLTRNEQVVGSIPTSSSMTEITVISGEDDNDYISLTDIAKYKTDENPGYVIQNWMRNRNVVQFLGLWERLNNPNFNCLEFEAIENEAGLNSFVLTPKKWIEKTGAIGMT